MGLFSFLKGAGQKLFGKAEVAAPEEKEPLKAQALIDHVQSLGLPFVSLIIKTADDTVILGGEVSAQEDAEKIALAVGNVEGVAVVDNNMTVANPEPEARFYTVKSGDSLSKISKEMYGDMMKYEIIFEANKPMLTDVDLIYPGQVLRIPNL
ncbi:MAG: peptidoglycan-binding protein LysM [Bacteroidota bacterium]